MPISRFGIATVQHFANLLREIRRTKRLGNEMGSRVQCAVMNDGVVSVAGHIEHFDPRTFQRQAVGQHSPAHLRHHDVGQQQVDLVLLRFAGQKRVLRTRGGQHCVAGLARDAFGNIAHGFLVLNDKNRLGSR
ncbi:MAG TPA: hypothetical protein VJ860_08650 [Polyangia bacterium]|nr:hypothetical protein [Polyangia bacterium]